MENHYHPPLKICEKNQSSVRVLTVARIAFCADKVAFTEKVGARERQVLTEGAVLLGPVVSDTRDFEKARSQ